jgi:hypothetical protein
MAIAVPFLLTAAGATATTVAMVSVAFAVTGINQKIDKAASNVFGEDLVKVATIAGLAYGAYNGGFGFGEGAGEAASGLSGMTAENAAGLADGFDTASQFVPPGGAEALANTPLDSALDLAGGGLEIAEGTNRGVNLQSLADGAKTTAQAAAPAELASTVTPDTGKLIGMKVNGVTAAPTGATASNATSDLYNLSTRASATADIAGKATAAAPTSFLDRLKATATSPTVLGGVIQGAAGGYASAAAQEAQREMYEKQLADRRRLASIGSAGYRVKG